MTRKLETDSKCEYEDCNGQAEYIVYSRRRREVLLCCFHHVCIVEDEGNPEYTHKCENCGCTCPIN